MGIVHAKSLDSDENKKVNLRNLKANVQRIHVDGLGRTKDDLVIANVSDVFSATDFYDVVLRIHEARSRLENIGCFKAVGVLVDTYDGPDAVENGVEVTFEVSELKLLGAKVNTSIGNNEGTVTSGGVLNNVFGRGEELSSEYSYGTKRTSSFHTNFLKPFHNDAGTVLTSGVYQQDSEAPWSGYKELNRGLLLTLAFSSASDLQHKIILDTAWRHLTCLSRSTAFLIREQAGHSIKSALKFESCLDKRNSPIFPSDGFLLSFKNELAGLGGDIGFFKNEVQVQVNVPVIDEVVIQGALQAGYMVPLQNNKTHCVSDRFVLGGPMNLRGFEFAGVGPHIDGCALGSETFWATALHIYSPLPLLGKGGSISDKFRIHGFVNTGNAGDFEFGDDIKANARMLLQGFRLSYGVGLAMNLGGIARVELNYCIPMLLQRGDRPCHGVQFGLAATFL